VLIFIYNVWFTHREGAPAPDDPWDARTLEWITPNPTPAYNYVEVPVVTHQDDFWHQKYSEDESGRLVRVAPSSRFVQRLATAADHIHMPSPSYWPLVAAFGAPIIAYGLVYKIYAISGVGALVLLSGLYAWASEPSTEPPDPEDLLPEAPALPSGTAAAAELPAGAEPAGELAGVGAVAPGAGPAGPAASGAPGASGGGDPGLPAGDAFTPEDQDD
jgi:cytochrome c oxidase subunit 1